MPRNLPNGFSHVLTSCLETPKLPYREYASLSFILSIRESMDLLGQTRHARFTRQFTVYFLSCCDF